MKNKRQKAFSLPELLIYLVVLSVLGSLAASYWMNTFRVNRVRSAAQEVFIQLHAAKSEAIKRNQRVYIMFQTKDEGGWCFGLKIQQQCDCFIPNSCQVDGREKVFRNIAHDGIVLEPHLTAPGNRLIFDGAKSTTTNTFGHLTIKDSNLEIRVIISRSLRIRFCSPSGNSHMAGYTNC